MHTLPTSATADTIPSASPGHTFLHILWTGKQGREIVLGTNPWLSIGLVFISRPQDSIYFHTAVSIGIQHASRVVTRYSVHRVLLQLWTTDLLMMRKAQDRAGLHGGLGGLQGMKGLAGFGANLASNKFVRAAIREEVRRSPGNHMYAMYAMYAM